MEEVLATAAETSAPVLKTIKALLEIEELGAEVEVLVAEASDQEQMQKALDETITKFQNHQRRNPCCRHCQGGIDTSQDERNRR